MNLRYYILVFRTPYQWVNTMRFVQLLGFYFLLFWCAPAFANKNPFRVEIFPVTSQVGNSSSININIVVPPKHHIYRDMVKISVVNSGGLKLEKAQIPGGTWKPDVANGSGQREQFDSNFTISIPYTGDETGVFSPVFEVSYQGCRDGLCYFPQIEKHSITVTVDAKSVTPSDNTTKVKSAPKVSVDFSSLPPEATVKTIGPDGKPHPVVARLLVDRTTVTPGETFRLGVHLTMLDEWHTYWKSPGDIGLPTNIKWSLPTGASSTPYEFPLPHRYNDGVSTSYGYSDSVLFFTEVSVPADLPAGEITLGAEAEWLVCKTQCIKGGASLQLPVQVASQPSTKSPFAVLFDSFAQQHPTPLSKVTEFTVTDGLSVSGLQSEKSFQYVIEVTPTANNKLTYLTEKDKGTWPLFTPIVNGSYMIDNVELKAKDGGGVYVLVSATTFEAYDDEPLLVDEQIGGLLQIQVADKTIRTEIVSEAKWVRSTEAVSPLNTETFQQAKSAAVLSAVFGSTITEQPNKEKTAKASVDPSSSTEPVQQGAEDEAVQATTEAEEEKSYLLMLFFAFLGGLILNIMPCVLPVLTLKLYSLIEQKDISAAKRRRAGTVYSLGVIASFLALALLVIYSKYYLETQFQWGFQSQSAGFNITLATICFVFGLSLFGVFEVPTFGADSMDKASAKEGLVGYFLTGVFTTLLATPCSAPFLGTGMGFAFSLPDASIALFFAVAGLGLAFPFLVIAYVPATMRFLPRPGAWMESFKQIMGFSLIATTVWLINPMFKQVGNDGVIGFLSFLTAVGLGCWVFGKFGSAIESGRRQLTMFLTAVGISLVVGWIFLDSLDPPQKAEIALPGLADGGESILSFAANGAEFQKLTIGKGESLGMISVADIPKGVDVVQVSDVSASSKKLVFLVNGKRIHEDTLYKKGRLDVSKIPANAKEVEVRVSLDTDLGFDFSEEIPWQPFSEEAVDVLSTTDYTVFIDFTADWCATCKVNERTVLETEAVRAAMKDNKVFPMKADNTNPDKTIEKWLKHFERAGVPMYLVIPPNRKKGFANYASSIVNLGETITPSEVIDAIKAAK